MLEAVSMIAAKINGPKEYFYEKRGGAIYIVILSSIPTLEPVFSTIFQHVIYVRPRHAPHAISSDYLNKLGTLHKVFTPW